MRQMSPESFPFNLLVSRLIQRFSPFKFSSAYDFYMQKLDTMRYLSCHEIRTLILLDGLTTFEKLKSVFKDRHRSTNEWFCGG